MAFNFVKLFILKIVLFIPLTILQIIEKLKDKKKHIIPLQDRYGIECFLGLAR